MTFNIFLYIFLYGALLLQETNIVLKKKHGHPALLKHVNHRFNFFTEEKFFCLLQNYKWISVLRKMCSCSVCYKENFYWYLKEHFFKQQIQKIQYHSWSNRNWILDPPLYCWQPGDGLVGDGLYRDLLTTTFQYEHVSLRKPCIW